MQKYIIINETKPIIFDITLCHKDIAGEQNVTSAGFVDRDGTCFGLADSLGITSKKSDTKLIRTFLRLTFKPIK